MNEVLSTHFYLRLKSSYSVALSCTTRVLLYELTSYFNLYRDDGKVVVAVTSENIPPPSETRVRIDDGKSNGDLGKHTARDSSLAFYTLKRSPN